jgi:phosphatidylglycerophosphate synthase
VLAVATGPLSWDEYARGWAELHGGYDPHASPWVDGWLRVSYRLARLAAALRASPGAVTTFGLAVSAAAALVTGPGATRPLVAAGLVLLATLADGVDGAVAVITQRTSRTGYVYDSVADRLAEACWLVALWRLGVPAPLLVAVGALSWLHEYVRARATAGGMREVGAVTVAERPTRVIITTLALTFGALAGLRGEELRVVVATVAIAGWLVLGVLGLAQLVRAVRGGLS